MSVLPSTGQGEQLGDKNDSLFDARISQDLLDDFRGTLCLAGKLENAGKS
jgi:hypothetical protein